MLVFFVTNLCLNINATGSMVVFALRERVKAFLIRGYMGNVGRWKTTTSRCNSLSLFTERV